MGGICKIKKRGGSMEQGQVFVKGWGGGGGGLVLFLFNFSKGLSFLHLEIILLFAKLSYAFEEKKNFSATIIL